MKLSSYMVQAKDVYHIAWEACRELQLDLIAAIGDTNGIGTLKPGECFQNSGGDDLWNADEYAMNDAGAWAFPDAIVSGPPPSVSSGGSGLPSVDMHVAERSMGMLTLDKAGDALKAAVRNAISAMSGKLKGKAREMIARRIPGGYRFQALGFRAATRGNSYMRSAVAKLVSATLTRKRRRVGVQQICTRNTSLKHGAIRFSFSWAYRAYPGRQALPVHVWKARYYARLAKRRKTQRRSPHTGIHVPPLKGGRARPRQEVNLAKSHGTVTQPFDEWSASEALDLLLSDVE